MFFEKLYPKRALFDYKYGLGRISLQEKRLLIKDFFGFMDNIEYFEFVFTPWPEEWDVSNEI